MSIYQEIRVALETHLSNTPGIPDIAWENVSFSPTTNQPYVKPFFQPVLREQAAMATTPPHYYRGLFTILCYQPEGSGPGASQNLVDTLVDRFATNTDLTSGPVTVRLRETQQERSYINSPWFITPVTVRWHLYHT